MNWNPDFNLLHDLLKKFKVVLDSHPNKDKFNELHNAGCPGSLDEDIANQVRVLSNLYTKNTCFHLTFVDSEAFRELLDGCNEIDDVYVEYDDDGNPDKLIAKLSYYTMNPHGFHIGYENYTIEWKLIKRDTYNLHGFPLRLNETMLFPDSWECTNQEFPEEEHPELDHHDDDCLLKVSGNYDEHDFKAEPFPDDCDCGLNDHGEYYNHPDSHTYEDIIQSFFDAFLYGFERYDGHTFEEATWNQETGDWELGDKTFNLKQFNEELAENVGFKPCK